MANIPLGFWQANLRLTGAPLPSGAEVTFAGVTNGMSPTATGEEIADHLVASNFLSYVDNEIVCSSILVKFGPNDTGPAAEVPTNIPGGDAGDSSPPNVAMLVSKLTGSGGRKGRGRFFLPGVGENDVGQGGLLTVGAQGGVQTNMNSFHSLMAASDLGLVLLHSDNTAPYNVTSLAVQSRVATQRRRLRR